MAERWNLHRLWVVFALIPPFSASPLQTAGPVPTPGRLICPGERSWPQITSKTAEPALGAAARLKRPHARIARYFHNASAVETSPHRLSVLWLPPVSPRKSAPTLAGRPPTNIRWGGQISTAPQRRDSEDGSSIKFWADFVISRGRCRNFHFFARTARGIADLLRGIPYPP